MYCWWNKNLLEKNRGTFSCSLTEFWVLKGPSEQEAECLICKMSLWGHQFYFCVYCLQNYISKAKGRNWRSILRRTMSKIWEKVWSKSAYMGMDKPPQEKRRFRPHPWGPRSFTSLHASHLLSIAALHTSAPLRLLCSNPPPPSLSAIKSPHNPLAQHAQSAAFCQHTVTE